MSTKKRITSRHKTALRIVPDDVVLSFSAKLVSDNAADQLREFVISFSLNSGTFTVAEKVIPNSGFPGGRFFNRTTCSNPDTGKPYKPCDVAVGKEVVINGWRFLLKEASEGTLQAMESRSDLFKSSDIDLILSCVRKALKGKIAEFTGKLEKADPKRHGKVPQDTLIRALVDYGVTLDQQQAITLFRKYSFADTDLFRYKDFVADLG